MNNTEQTVPLTAETLRKAAELAELIETKRNELNALLAGKAIVSTPVKAGGKRQLSPEAIAAIRLGQKRRWKKVHQAEKANATPVVVTEPPVGTPEPAKGFETPPLEPTA